MILHRPKDLMPPQPRGCHPWTTDPERDPSQIPRIISVGDNAENLVKPSDVERPRRRFVHPSGNMGLAPCTLPTLCFPLWQRVAKMLGQRAGEAFGAGEQRDDVVDAVEILSLSAFEVGVYVVDDLVLFFLGCW